MSRPNKTAPVVNEAKVVTFDSTQQQVAVYHPRDPNEVRARRPTANATHKKETRSLCQQHNTTSPPRKPYFTRPFPFLFFGCLRFVSLQADLTIALPSPHDNEPHRTLCISHASRLTSPPPNAPTPAPTVLITTHKNTLHNRDGRATPSRISRRSSHTLPKPCPSRQGSSPSTSSPSPPLPAQLASRCVPVYN